MKYKDYYVIELFVPTEIICSIESGYLDLRLCKKVEEGFLDVENKRLYQIPNDKNNLRGIRRINKVMPLNDYYYLLGIKKKKNNYRTTEVHALVKTLKASKKI